MKATETKKPDINFLPDEKSQEQSEPKKKFHAFKYWADVIKWIVVLVGDIVDSVKENPFPKKDDYTN